VSVRFSGGGGYSVGRLGLWFSQSIGGWGVWLWSGRGYQGFEARDFLESLLFFGGRARASRRSVRFSQRVKRNGVIPLMTHARTREVGPKRVSTGLC